MAELHEFNANEVDPTLPFDPIPADEYSAVITNSEEKPTKAGTGTYLELTFQIVEGEYQNRLLWTRLNLNNPTDRAVQIARAELSAICRAVGVLTPKDSAELHDLPLLIKVKQKRRKDTDEIVNEIVGYRMCETVTEAQARTPEDTPPWARS